MIKVKEIFNFPQMEKVVVKAGRKGLERSVRWVHVIDHEDVGDFLEGGELLLACGQVWPNNEETVEQLLNSFLQKEIAGIVFATGRYLEETPKQVITFGDKHAIPILEVPFEVSFVKVTRMLHETILNKTHRTQPQVAEISQELVDQFKSSATDVAEICRIVANYLGSYVLVTDSQNRILFKANPPGSKHLNDRTVVSKLRETIEMQVYDELKEGTLMEDNRAIYLPSKKPPYVLFVPIQINPNSYYTLWIFDPYRPLNTKDEIISEYTASAIHDALIAEDKAKTELTKRRKELMHYLLQQDRIDIQTLEETARQLDLTLSGPYVYGRFIFHCGHDSPPRELDKLAWRDTCQQWIDETPGVSGLCEIFGEDLFFLFRFDDTESYEQLFQLFTEYRRWNVSAPILVVSQVKQNLLAMAEADQETKLLSLIIQARNGRDPIYFAEQYQRELLLYRNMDEEKADQLRRLILPKEILEEGKNGPLYETLKALAINEYNRERTAKTLHIHRNTLRYRVNRIEKLLGSSITSLTNQFWIQVALDLEWIAQKLNK